MIYKKFFVKNQMIWLIVYVNDENLCKLMFVENEQEESDEKILRQNIDVFLTYGEQKELIDKFGEYDNENPIQRWGIDVFRITNSNVVNNMNTNRNVRFWIFQYDGEGFINYSFDFSRLDTDRAIIPHEIVMPLLARFPFYKDFNE